MSTYLSETLYAFAPLLIAGFLAHEPWRWFGLLLGRNLTIESEVFHWVRLVSTALVSALALRFVLIPQGALAPIPWPVRVGAFAAGLAVFLLARRSLAAGVVTGVVVLIALQGLR